jgi:hypothetical protein
VPSQCHEKAAQQVAELFDILALLQDNEVHDCILYLAGLFLIFDVFGP